SPNAAAALFSLPFGLRALVFMDPLREPVFQNPPVLVFPHQPTFNGGLAAAQQLRLIATGGGFPSAPLDPARMMPGRLRQTSNLFDNAFGLNSVLPEDIARIFQFEFGVPLHAVDLSGYGLSCFSNWHLDPIAGADTFGITQVRFDVLLGRTAYEVVQVRSVLAACQARLVRTIVLERRNSGRVRRFDSGW